MTRTKRLTDKPSKYNHSKFWMPTLLFVGMVLLILVTSWVNWIALLQPIQDFVFQLEAGYEQWLSQQSSNHPLILILFAFIGGLIASFAPCKLALLPVNLSYIGTREINSRWDAFVKAGSFVLGVVTVLSLLGLFASFAGAVVVDFWGYVNVAVGLIMLVMGLVMVEIVRLPSLKTTWELPSGWGAYGVGLTFALVSSPCASPVLFSVLAAAGATGSQLYSTLTMVSYALGNTAVIFLASLFTGLAKQTRFLLKYSQEIMRLAAGLLILTGGYYLVNGIRWFFLVMGNHA